MMERRVFEQMSELFTCAPEMVAQLYAREG
jgi:hypothetical protein